MRLKSLLQVFYLFIFLVIIPSCTSAVVDVGIQEVTVSELSPDYPTDRSPEPGEDFEVNVTIENYGDESTEGTIIVYLDKEEKDSWGTFSIKPGEVVSQQFNISHGDCGTYNVNVKIVMNDNVPNHDWELSVPVKIGKIFYVNIAPEKAVVGRPVRVEIKNDLGLNVEDAKIMVEEYNLPYKVATSKGNEIFSFIPDNVGNFLMTITKEKEGYCEYTKQIEVKHNITVYGPYFERYPGDPIAGDEIVMRIYDEEDKSVPGVSITVSGAEDIYLNTDRSGSVLFVVNKAGEHRIEMEKNTPPHWGTNKTIYVQAKPVLMINVSPEKPLTGDDVEIKVMNKNISNVSITLTNPEGFNRTLAMDKDRKITFNAGSPGEYIILAEHNEYTPITREIKVYNLLKILFDPKNPAMGDNMTIVVLDQKDYPVPNAVVSIKDTEEFNETTNYKGGVNFKLKSKNYTITAKKEDYISATAVITPVVKNLSLKLSSKKLKIDEVSIYISVTEKDTITLVSAKITIEGKETGFKVEENASNFTFTPEFADAYKISATKDNYESAEDSFVVEPAPMNINASINNSKKEIIIKITSVGRPLHDVNVSVITPKGSIINPTDKEGIVRINLDAGGEGDYLIRASKTPNYEWAEVRVKIVRNQEYWWLWLILLIILITGLLLRRF